jgi:DNA replication protein DnaC
MTLEHKCVLSERCKYAGNEHFCNQKCYPFVVMHGLNGDGGFWKSTGVPKRYRNSFLKTLPIEEQNPEAYKFIKRYIEKIGYCVSNGIGLYLYSVPSPINRMGTGTGKTTVAAAIVNEYVIHRVIEHVTRVREIVENPALFVKASEFQNVYNAQFRGTDELREQASQKYYSLKRQMMNVELLVIDDIALRGTTEAYKDEFYEIIDRRYNENLCTIFTSNLPLSEIGDILSPQIASRIEGMTEQILFVGEDNRKGGVL